MYNYFRIELVKIRARGRIKKIKKGCGFCDISTLPRPYSTCLERWLWLFLSTAEVDDEGNLAVVEEVSAPIWRAEKLAWQRTVNSTGAAST